MYSTVPTMAPAIVAPASGSLLQRLEVERFAFARRTPLPPRPGRARDPEVHDRRLVVGADHDVGRLEVAMNDARVMRGDEARRRCPRDAERSRDRQLRLAA